MGDVRVTAAATLGAAMVAVVGSIIVVALNGRVQQGLLLRQLQGQAAERRAQWAEERERASQAAQVAACVAFDAAVVVAIARFQRPMDLVTHPGLRRRLLGWRWAQRWDAAIQQAFADLAPPYSTIRYATNPTLLAAADAVMEALSALATTSTAVPEPLPPEPLPLLRRRARARWRARVQAAQREVSNARQALIAVLDPSTGDPAPDAM